MTYFNVTVSATIIHEVTVQAETEAEAKEKAVALPVPIKATLHDIKAHEVRLTPRMSRQNRR
jgi:hypothetical protein